MKKLISKTEYINVTQHEGKMEGVPSISTNKYLNENCKKLMASTNEKCICHYCFVDKVTARYKALEPALTHNTELLTSRLLTVDELSKIGKIFANTLIVRFESFGDLNNETQLINYMNIAKTCVRTKFALFTKHFSIVRNYFNNGYTMPDNVTLVLSSPFMETSLTEMFVNSFKKYHERTITFTVTKDKKSPEINCGGRKCIECRNCYDSVKPHNVLELVK